MQIHGMTDEMRKFNPTPPGSVANSGGTSASGGMPEGDEFASAEIAAATDLGRFVADVQSGFAAYTRVVQQSAADYLQGDSAGAQAMPRESEFPLTIPGGN